MNEKPDPIEIKNREEKLHNARLNLNTILADLPELLKPITPEDGVNKQELEETLLLVRDFVANEVVRQTYTHAPVNLLGRQPLNDGFVSDISHIPERLREILTKQETLSLVRYQVSLLKDSIREAMERSKRREHAFLTVPEQAQLDALVEQFELRLTRLEEKHQLASATVRATIAAASAEASASKASSAAGVTADRAMSAFYQTLGKEELDAANTFRVWAIIIGVVAGLLACIFLFGEGLGVEWLVIEPRDYVHVLQRALVLGALLALATYLAKQSHQHRTMSNWARSLAVQLKTFDAFVDAVDDASVRDDLRKNFAVRVFGDHPAVKGEPAFTASSQSVAALTDTVTRLLPAAK